ncbi:hypothetical protein C8J57DRAFT_1229264 [Mycena rebaudengoi]|nr:hypothetical protein C8J57DRAFT_1229264 [Mycena rebaudengoi]
MARILCWFHSTRTPEKGGGTVSNAPRSSQAALVSGGHRGKEALCGFDAHLVEHEAPVVKLRYRELFVVHGRKDPNIAGICGGVGLKRQGRKGSKLSFIVSFGQARGLEDVVIEGERKLDYMRDQHIILGKWEVKKMYNVFDVEALTPPSRKEVYCVGFVTGSSFFVTPPALLSLVQVLWGYKPGSLGRDSLNTRILRPDFVRLVSVNQGEFADDRAQAEKDSIGGH